MYTDLSAVFWLTFTLPSQGSTLYLSYQQQQYSFHAALKWHRGKNVSDQRWSRGVFWTLICRPLHTQVEGSGFGWHQCSGEEKYKEDFSVYCLLWEKMPCKKIKIHFFLISHSLFCLLSFLLLFIMILYRQCAHRWRHAETLWGTSGGHIIQVYLNQLRLLLLDFWGQQTAESLPTLLLLHKLICSDL